jgi:hypothetical protein
VPSVQRRSASMRWNSDVIRQLPISWPIQPSLGEVGLRASRGGSRYGFPKGFPNL